MKFEALAFDLVTASGTSSTPFDSGFELHNLIIYRSCLYVGASEKLYEENNDGLKKIINDVLKETGTTPLKNEIITSHQAKNMGSVLFGFLCSSISESVKP